MPSDINKNSFLSHQLLTRSNGEAAKTGEKNTMQNNATVL